MNELTAYSPTHPGAVIKEELEYRQISQKKFAELVSMPYSMLNEILKGKRPVSAEFAMSVEAALGISADLLGRMQTRYNFTLARKDQKTLARLDAIRNICASLL